MAPLSCIPPTGTDLHSKSRPRLIYLPGIDGTGRLLYAQRRLFEEYDVRCVNYVQTRPNSYEELVCLGEAELGPEGATVLGESFGGAVALMLALKRPDLVKRLILINTFAWYPRQPMVHLAAFFGKYLPMNPSSPRTRGIRGLFFFPPDISKADQNAWWDRTADVPQRAYGWRIGLLAKVDLRPRLGEIDIPALVFVSPNDRVVPPTAGRLLAERLPKARLFEYPAGHAAMIHPKVDVARMLSEM